MKFKLSEIIDRIGEIILNPKTFWKSQKETDERLSVLLGGHFLPLLLIVVLVVFLGEFFRSAHFYGGFAALKAVRKFVLFILEFFVAVYITNVLIKTFDGEKNIRLSRQLVTYSFTPFLLVSMVTGLFPFLYPLDILGAYSFYIFWIGGKEILTLPEEKRDSYLVLTIIVNFFVFSFLSILLTKLLTAYY